MADFKDELSPALVAALAGELRRGTPAFPAEAFVADATDGLERLELMARVRQVAAALARHLPQPFEAAVAALDAALESPSFTGWMTLPATYAVAELGLDEPELALPALARLTPRWSSEGAIRPFVERHPELALAHLRRWARDPDEHVRRLVSEGTRPRLPWAPQLRGFVADPTSGLELLELLHDDPSEYVRRSVANHLNDISKDHPELAVETARRWLDAGGADAQRTVRHALRTLVKRGHPEALTLLGFDPHAPVRLHGLAVAPERVAVGGTVELSFTLAADARTPVVVDYAVEHAGARGARAAKVFKLTTRTLEPGRPERFVRRHAFREVSVRRLYPGTHRIAVQVNGRALGSVAVELEPPG